MIRPPPANRTARRRHRGRIARRGPRRAVPVFLKSEAAHTREALPLHGPLNPGRECHIVEATAKPRPRCALLFYVGACPEEAEKGPPLPPRPALAPAKPVARFRSSGSWEEGSIGRCLWRAGCASIRADGGRGRPVPRGSDR